MLEQSLSAGRLSPPRKESSQRDKTRPSNAEQQNHKKTGTVFTSDNYLIPNALCSETFNVSKNLRMSSVLLRQKAGFHLALNCGSSKKIPIMKTHQFPKRLSFIICALKGSLVRRVFRVISKKPSLTTFFKYFYKSRDGSSSYSRPKLGLMISLD